MRVPDNFPNDIQNMRSGISAFTKSIREIMDDFKQETNRRNNVANRLTFFYEKATQLEGIENEL